jgi:AcrR family transcriptional regulator
VESHRQEVREAILDAAGQLVANHGILGISMSQLAESTGIGRATLYKYFDDVQQVLAAWHQRQVAGHLEELSAIANRPAEPEARLRSVLEAYGRMCRQRRRHGGDALAAVLHRAKHIDRPERELRDLVAGLLTEAAATGAVRTDVPTVELASYCVHAMAAAGDSDAAARITRLVDLVCSGLALTGNSRAHGGSSKAAAGIVA